MSSTRTTGDASEDDLDHARERALTWLAWRDEDPEIRQLAAEQLAANYGYASESGESGRQSTGEGSS
jgi:hypothetical protein